MIDKEKIKQEIEQLINDKTDGKHVAKADIIAPKRSAYLDILNFIDSLPEESGCEVNFTTKSEDLEEAAVSIIKRLGGMEKDDCVSEHELKIFKAAIDWQKKKDQETIELAEDHAMLAGMNKMKDEMMKDAVDAGVYQGLYSKYVKERDGEALVNVLKNYNSGDKVKIIIVKTEQQ